MPLELTTLSRASGHGRMWRHVLDGLGPHVEILTGRKAKRADVWLANGHDGALDTDKPWIAHVHEAGWFTDELRAVLDPTFLEMIDRATGEGVRAATRVIVPSASAKGQIVEGYGVDPDRIDVAHHGVDTTMFRPLVVPPGPPYVLFAGTFHPRKNLPLVREAVGSLIAEGHELDLIVVAGPAPDRADSAELERQGLQPIAGREVRRITDPTDGDLAKLMSGALALCLPSLSEGFGLPVLEAMACACPVVVSDRGALPEVAGDAGLVVEPDARAIAGALASLLADPDRAHALGEAGLQRARGFSWDASVEVWLQSIGRALA